MVEAVFLAAAVMGFLSALSIVADGVLPLFTEAESAAWDNYGASPEDVAQFFTPNT